MTVELNGRGEVPVACACGWDSGGRLTMVDRWVTDRPPIPYTGPIVEVYGDGDDPESRVSECGRCGGDLDLGSCVELASVAKGRQRATITDPGKPGYHYGEPRVRLEDGREMPVGWNIGKSYPVGTEGWAEYVSTPSAGLWQFTPDEGNS